MFRDGLVKEKEEKEHRVIIYMASFKIYIFPIRIDTYEVIGEREKEEVVDEREREIHLISRRDKILPWKNYLYLFNYSI